MTECLCEPCGAHCSCKCHDRQKSLRADGGRPRPEQSADLIADDPAVSRELP